MEQARPDILVILKERMSKRKDLPAMSRTVALVKKYTSDVTDTSISELTNAILDDFALTKKLLHLVNSVYYLNYQLEGKISTISRAVFVLGYEQVKNAALALTLLENLGSEAVASEMKETVMESFVAAIIAKGFAEKMKEKDTEEVFLCTIFYNLGKILTSFYLPEFHRKIIEVAARQKVSEEAAAKAVLGITYEQVGLHVSGEWGFPERIMKSMKRLPRGRVVSPGTPDEKLQSIVNFSSELSSAMGRISTEPARLASLLKRYEDALPISEEAVKKAIDVSKQEFNRYAGILKISVKKSRILRDINVYLGYGQDDGMGEKPPQSADASQELDDTQVLQLMGSEGPTDLSDNPEAILSGGIQEVTRSLAENATVNDILRLILEIMYRGMKFQHVLFCIKSTASAVMQGRFGLGADIDALVKKFQFPITASSDIFNLAISRNSDIVIKNVNDPIVRARIPSWYRSLIKTNMMVIFPVVINDKPIGLIYADKGDEGETKMPAHHLTFLKTLRNQAVMAIKRRA